jgi:hypothetical protein
MGKFSLAVKMPISEETAMSQVMSFLEYYGKDPDDGDKDKQKSVESMLSRVLKYIRQGIIEIRPDMTISQKLQKPSPGSTATEITYRKFKSSDVIDTEDSDEKFGAVRLNRLLGTLSSLGPDVFTNSLEPIDYKVSEAIGILFFM